MAFKRNNQQPAAGGGGFKRNKPAAAPAPTEPDPNEPGFLQSLFDVRATGGGLLGYLADNYSGLPPGARPEAGESLIWGNKPKLSAMEQQLEDINTAGGDTASRGFGAKIAGDQERVDAARERLPDLVEFPVDMLSAAVTSPVRGYSMLVGGAEGALNEYGHQDDWTPDKEDMQNILLQTGIGAGTAGAGDLIGRWGSKGINLFRSPDKEPLYKAADRATKRKDAGKTLTSAAEDKIARADRMGRAQRANTEGRGGFEKMLKGMDDQPKLSEADKLFGKKEPPPASRIERDLLAKLAGKPNLVSSALKTGGRAAQKFSMFGFPAVVGALMQGAGDIADVGRYTDWAKLQREIIGKGAEKADKAFVEAGRNKLSKTATSGYRAYQNNDEDKKKKR